MVRSRAEQVQAWLKKVKPFSWEATLLMSGFSWSVFLLVQGDFAKHLISAFAWSFLIVAVDWALLGKTITIPLIGIKVQYGPWLTGAIACVALLSNNFIITSLRSALISWPIFSAVFAGYSRFIQPGLRWQVPNPEKRQELVILFLICGLFSSWFQFHFLIQDVLQQYPNLLADNFDRSAFVVRLNPVQRTTSKAYPLLETTETIVREELLGKNWIEVQRWLRNIKDAEAAIEQEAINRIYSDQNPREQQLWQITTDTAFEQTGINLVLRAKWRGATSRPGNYYILRRSCAVTEAVVPPPKSFEDLQKSSAYQLTCQPTQEER